VTPSFFVIFGIHHFVVVSPGGVETKLNADAQLQTFSYKTAYKPVSMHNAFLANWYSQILPFFSVTDK